MRRSREKTAETRRKIVETASRLFRQRGIAAVGVADVMGALGLTVGGFYRHFESKDVLVAEAIASAAAASTANHARTLPGAPPAKRATALVASYLSKLHVERADVGCPVAALCSEVAHEPRPTREAFTTAVRGLLDVVGEVMPGESKTARERRLRTAASLVGAVVLARASSDEGLADDLLTAVKRGLADDARRATPGRTRTKQRSP